LGDEARAVVIGFVYESLANRETARVRIVITLLISIATALARASAAQDAYPSRPITLVAPIALGDSAAPACTSAHPRESGEPALAGVGG
jgi:hypothetical protein